jgi:hypothetical protein
LDPSTHFFYYGERFSCTLNAPQGVQSRFGGSLKCDNTLNGYLVVIIISAGSGRRGNRYSPLHYPAGILIYRSKRNSPELFLYEREIFLKKRFFTPGKRFELLRCRAPVAFKATAFPD